MKTSNQKYSVSTNSDIRHLLLSGIKSGSHPTIVAIPLYIRGNLSKLPSIFDILSATSLQSDPKTKDVSLNSSKGFDVKNSAKIESQIQNSSLFTHKYVTQPPKLTKIEPKEEPQRVGRPYIKKEQIFDTGSNEPNENKPQMQWSSVVGVHNRYTEPNDKITLLRGSFQRNQASSEPRKQEDYNPVGHQNSNKFNDKRYVEQNYGGNSNFDIISNTKKTNNNFDSHNRNYAKLSTPSVFDSNIYKIDSKNSPDIISHYNSYNVDNSGEAMDQNYMNTPKDNENNYQTQENPKKVSFNDNQQNPSHHQSSTSGKSKYQSSYVMSYENPHHSQYPVQPIAGTYSSKSNNLKGNYNYDYSYATNPYSSSLSESPVVQEPSSSYFPHSSSDNFQPIQISNNDFHSTTSNFGPNSPKTSFVIDQWPNNYNLNSHSIPSQNLFQSTDQKPFTVSHKSNDYSTSEDIECNDENVGDYTNTDSTSGLTPQTTKQEFETKTNERDNYETEEIDPTKLDLKIVHLPISLLRRLIGSGDIGLPSYQ